MFSPSGYLVEILWPTHSSAERNGISCVQFLCFNTDNLAQCCITYLTAEINTLQLET